MDMTSQGVIEVRKRVVKVRVVPTEVFSRIVGYYRPIQDWHKGKVEEFYARKMLRISQELQEEGGFIDEE